MLFRRITDENRAEYRDAMKTTGKIFAVTLSLISFAVVVIVGLPWPLCFAVLLTTVFLGGLLGAILGYFEVGDYEEE